MPMDGLGGHSQSTLFFFWEFERADDETDSVIQSQIQADLHPVS